VLLGWGAAIRVKNGRKSRTDLKFLMHFLKNYLWHQQGFGCRISDTEIQLDMLLGVDVLLLQGVRNSYGRS
jgi:hypothetical protein